MKISSNQIRNTFLDFFQEKQHLLISGSSILPENDPTLLFINSGMAPLKKYFLGLEAPPQKRLCNIQRCIRTNDIDSVGDRHHLTAFEMLGSWSIGDYYKEQAIALAYELLVGRLKIDPKLLYVTVYKGNPNINLPVDQESIDAWLKVGVPRDHIVELGEDNFWGPAGETGPCGPCTEVFFDTGAENGPDYVPGGFFDDKSRYIEIWNAGVFMEFNKTSEGEYTKLPLKSVDTGSGLERMTMALNGYSSVYETDLLKPIVDAAKRIFIDLNLDETEARIIADHFRSLCMITFEGVGFSNDGRGYIPRKLLRKCIAILSGCNGDLAGHMATLFDLAVSTMEPILAPFLDKKDLVRSRFLNEIMGFLPTIEKGLQLLRETMPGIQNGVIGGKIIFDLVTTHGLPVEVLARYAKVQGFSLDWKAYEELFDIHRDHSRGDKKKILEKAQKVLSDHKASSFAGYSHSSLKSTVALILKDNVPVERASGDAVFYILFEETPFYPEGGGPQGDKGTANGPNFALEILDTQKIGQHILHECRLVEGEVVLGDEAKLEVDTARRNSIKRNHSATHLLNSALSKVTGAKIKQKGSSVSQDRLRFDFTLERPLTENEIIQVENLVNGWILQNTRASISVMKSDQAKTMGALFLENENYSEDVRVVKLSDESVELCGGIHVDSTAEIGLFSIVAETGISKGVRRIEAITGLSSLSRIQSMRQTIKTLASSLATSEDKLIVTVQDLRKRATNADSEQKSASQLTLIKRFEKSEHSVAMYRCDTEPKALRERLNDLMSKGEHDAVCAVSFTDSTSVLFFSNKRAALVMPADQVVRNLTVLLNGKGGGKSEFAQCGGPLPEDIKTMIMQIEAVIQSFRV